MVKNDRRMSQKGLWDTEPFSFAVPCIINVTMTSSSLELRLEQAMPQSKGTEC